MLGTRLLTRRAVNPSPGLRRRKSGSQANPATFFPFLLLTGEGSGPRHRSRLPRWDEAARSTTGSRLRCKVDWLPSLAIGVLVGRSLLLLLLLSGMMVLVVMMLRKNQGRGRKRNAILHQVLLPRESACSAHRSERDGQRGHSAKRGASGKSDDVRRRTLLGHKSASVCSMCMLVITDAAPTE